MTTKRKPLLNVNLRWFLLAMILANIAGQMGYSMLSLYLIDLGANVAQVGLVFTLASLVPTGLQILGGWLSDTIGRLRIIAIGSFISVFGWLIFFIAPSWEWVLVGLCLDYVSNSVVGPSFSAYIAEQSSKEERGRVFGLQPVWHVARTAIPALSLDRRAVVGTFQPASSILGHGRSMCHLDPHRLVQVCLARQRYAVTCVYATLWSQHARGSENRNEGVIPCL
jgi:MFS family permease